MTLIEEIFNGKTSYFCATYAPAESTKTTLFSILTQYCQQFIQQKQNGEEMGQSIQEWIK